MTKKDQEKNAARREEGRERDKEGRKYRERGERERFKDAMLPTLKTEEGATS